MKQRKMKAKKKYLIRALSLDKLMVLSEDKASGCKLTWTGEGDRFACHVTLPLTGADCRCQQENEAFYLYDRLLGTAHTLPAEGVYPQFKNRVLFLDTELTRKLDVPPTVYFTRENGSAPKAMTRSELIEHLMTCGLTVTFEGDPTGVEFAVFEKSASMIRNGKLMFIRREDKAKLTAICSLGLEVFGEEAKRQLPSDTADFAFSKLADLGWMDKNYAIQLTKWTAYKGLTLSDSMPTSLTPNAPEGLRYDEDTVLVVPDTIFSGDLHLGGDTLSPKKFWTAENLLHMVYTAQAVPKEELKDNTYPVRAAREYQRFSPVTPFDGEGLLDPRWAAVLRSDTALPEDDRYSSFQVRGAFVKGMLHQVDFHRYLKEKYEAAPGNALPYEALTVRDIFGVERNLSKVRVILPKSMFKAKDWLEKAAGTAGGESADPMKFYFTLCRHWDWGLFVCRVNSIPERTATLNYQILNTAGLPGTVYEALTRKAVDSYDTYRKDTEAQLEELTGEVEDAPEGDDLTTVLPIRGEGKWMERSLALLREKNVRVPDEKNPFFSGCAIRQAQSNAEKILNEASRAHLAVSGSTLFLSADLMSFLAALWVLVQQSGGMEHPTYDHSCDLTGEEYYLSTREDRLPEEYRLNGKPVSAIFRNPHMSRSEHRLAYRAEKNEVRERLLGHLVGVCMLPARSLAAAALSGADMDGDIVKVIFEPGYVESLHATLQGSLEQLETQLTGDADYQSQWEKAGCPQKPQNTLSNLPPVVIPSLLSGGDKALDEKKLLKRNARLFLAGSNSRVGSFSNIGFVYGSTAYAPVPPEETEEQRQRRIQRENDVIGLTIAVGLEIDSVKTGIRPDPLTQTAAGTEYTMRITQRPPFLSYVQGDNDSIYRNGKKVSYGGRYFGKLRPAKGETGAQFRQGLNALLTHRSAEGSPMDEEDYRWLTAHADSWLDVLPWYLQNQKKAVPAEKPRWKPASLARELGLPPLPDRADPDWERSALYLYLLSQLASAYHSAGQRVREGVAPSFKNTAHRILFRQGMWSDTLREARVTELKSAARGFVDGLYEAEAEGQTSGHRQVLEQLKAAIAAAPGETFSLSETARRLMDDTLLGAMAWTGHTADLDGLDRLRISPEGGGWLMPLLLLRWCEAEKARENKRAYVTLSEPEKKRLVDSYIARLKGDRSKKAANLFSRYRSHLLSMEGDRAEEALSMARAITAAFYPKEEDPDSRLLSAALVLADSSLAQADRLPGWEELCRLMGIADREDKRPEDRFNKAVRQENLSEDLLFKVCGELFFRAYRNYIDPPHREKEEEKEGAER